MGTHEDYKEMLAAHALGSLDAGEAPELEAHLAACAECRAELEEGRETASLLAYAAPAAAPSAAVRSKLLERVRAEKREAGAGSNVVPLERPKPAAAAPRALPRWAALAASVAFIALALSLVLLWNRYSGMRQELARLSDRLSQTQGELERERLALVREREVRELLAAPDAQMMTLKGTEEAAQARARFVYDRRTGRAMLMADDLPQAPAGKAYQLWFIAEGKAPMPGHVFNSDAAGHAEMSDQMPEEARGATVFAVTLEPASGVPAPTGPKYLLGAS